MVVLLGRGWIELAGVGDYISYRLGFSLEDLGNVVAEDRTSTIDHIFFRFSYSNPVTQLDRRYC